MAYSSAYTASLTSSIENYPFENGRRYDPLVSLRPGVQRR